jgi:hypothetical protein
MSYKLTHEEKAFYKAYRLCVGTASHNSLIHFLSMKDKLNDLEYSEQQAIYEYSEYWSHIEDFWLLWQEAKEYALKPPLKTYKVTATYSTTSEVYIEAESVEQAHAMAKEGGDFDGTIDHDDWQIEHIEEVNK